MRIATGKCKHCGAPIGVEPEDLGKKPPPLLCDDCAVVDGMSLRGDGPAEALSKMFGFGKGKDRQC